MDRYVKIYRKDDLYVKNGNDSYFNVRKGGGGASREYAKWCLKTDRGCTDKEAETYLDMLILASQ